MEPLSQTPPLFRRIITQERGFIMKSNIGSADRIARVFLGIGLACFALLLPGNFRFIGLAGIILLVTSVINWCPIYALLRLGSRR